LSKPFAPETISELYNYNKSIAGALENQHSESDTESIIDDAILKTLIKKWQGRSGNLAEIKKTYGPCVKWLEKNAHQKSRGQKSVSVIDKIVATVDKMCKGSIDQAKGEEDINFWLDILSDVKNAYEKRK
jgi:hypothetical protein